MLNVCDRHDVMRRLHRNITKSWLVLNTQFIRCKGKDKGKSRSIGKGKSRSIGKGSIKGRGKA